MYLTKKQVELLVKKLGQPKASVLLNKIFNMYRIYLDSCDVRELYDSDYIESIRTTTKYLFVNKKYKIHIYNKYSYEYLLTKQKRGFVLDIGCGDGDFILALAFHGFKCVGVDLSKTMIMEAQRKAAREKLEVEFLHEDVSNLSTKYFFDYVVLNDVTEHLSDRELQKMFAHVKELLNPCGELIIHTPNGLALCNMTDNSFLQAVYKYYLRAAKTFAGFERTINQIFYDQLHINIKSFKQFRKFLSKFGFRSKVIYDEYNKSLLRSILSSNMLIIAWRKQIE